MATRFDLIFFFSSPSPPFLIVKKAGLLAYFHVVFQNLGKDLTWYAKDGTPIRPEKEEIDKVKEAESELMASML